MRQRTRVREMIPKETNTDTYEDEGEDKGKRMVRPLAEGTALRKGTRNRNKKAT